MSGPQLSDRRAPACWVCGEPGWGCINGAWFCTDHQEDIWRLQLGILSMESDIPLDLLESITVKLVEDILRDDDPRKQEDS